MDRLTRSFSTRLNNTDNNRKNSEIIINEDFEKDLSDWKMPVYSTGEVYKKSGSFIKKHDYVIKTVEQSIPLSEGYNVFHLLSKRLIELQKQTYKFLHIGMIQVALKPATRLGLNTSAIIAVRDKRHNKFHDSLLGIVESSLCDGPIYFSCVPNFTISLSDPNILHALCLDIKSEGFDMMPGTQNVILMYRIYYKVMNTVVPDMRKFSNKNPRTTTMFITDVAKSNTVIPKMISWDQVRLPDKWILEDAKPPVKQENTQLEEIVEYPDGDVEIRFSKNRITRLNLGSSSRTENLIPGRNSTSSIPLSSLEKEHISLKTTRDGVSQPEYKVEIPSSSSKVISPTPSDMGYEEDRSVYVLKNEENILEFPFSGKVKEMFYSSENEIKRKWFYCKKPEKQKKWFKYYKKFLEKMDEDSDFFDMIKSFYQAEGRKDQFPDFEKNETIAHIESVFQNFVTPKGKTIRSIHPPEVNLSIKINQDEIMATPYRKSNSTEAVVEQNNFTNLSLQTIGKQLTRIEQNINKNVHTEVINVSSTNKVEKDKVLFKPLSSEKLKMKMTETSESSEVLEEIIKRLKNLGIKDKEMAPITGTRDNNSEQVSENSDQEIDQIEEMFRNKQPIIPNEVSKISFGHDQNKKPYYPRPTPVDLLIEEQQYLNGASFNGTSIDEWNIDGLTEYQVQTKLHYMTMYATACRIKGNSDPEIAKAIIQGFTGQLKGWWDFYLSDEARLHIFNAVKIENNTQIADCVNTLIYTIAKHFIGSTSLQIDKTQEQLMNLKCHSLSHFKWYRDVFFSKIFSREDSQHDFWKEKFLSGLPHFFAERVKTRIRQKHQGTIPYHLYTYGDLASEVVGEGICLCNEIKLHKQIQKEKIFGKRVLGDFCEQIGLSPIKPVVEDGKNYKAFRRKNKTKHDKNKEKSFNQDRPKREKQNKTPVCWKCHKTGHYANKCKMKSKIQSLDIDNDFKKALKKLLIEDSDTEKEDLKISVITEENNSEKDSTTSQDSDDQSNCEGNCDYYKALCKANGLSVLTRNNNCRLAGSDIDPKERQKPP